jgi:hypothetical protein
MIALPINDGPQPPQQGFHEVPQELIYIFQTLIRSLKNPAGFQLRAVKFGENLCKINIDTTV